MPIRHNIPIGKGLSGYEAFLRRKAKELRHNNIMGQGESVLCNFTERAPVRKGIENPEKKELR